MKINSLSVPSKVIETNKQAKLLAFLMLFTLLFRVVILRFIFLLRIRGSLISLLANLADVLALPTLHRSRLSYVTNALSPIRRSRMNQYQ